MRCKGKVYYTWLVATLTINSYSCCLTLLFAPGFSCLAQWKELYPLPSQCVFSEVLGRHHHLSDSWDG